MAIVSQIVLTRSMSIAEYGQYSYAYEWIMLLVMIATFRMPTLVIRLIPAAGVETNWPLARGVIHWALRWQVVLAISATAVLLVFPFVRSDAAFEMLTFAVIAPAILLLSIGGLTDAVLCAN